jgi:hypothetical protein
MLLRSRHLARLRHRGRVLPGEALLPPAGVAAPQAVVALERLAQRVRTFTYRGQAGRGTLPDVGVWENGSPKRVWQFELR